MYLILRIFVLQLEHVHSSDHGVDGHEDVLVDQLYEAPLVVVRVSAAVDDAHLFYEGALARFSCT